MQLLFRITERSIVSQLKVLCKSLHTCNAMYRRMSLASYFYCVHYPFVNDSLVICMPILRSYSGMIKNTVCIFVLLRHCEAPIVLYSPLEVMHVILYSIKWVWSHLDNHGTKSTFSTVQNRLIRQELTILYTYLIHVSHIFKRCIVQSSAT